MKGNPTNLIESLAASDVNIEEGQIDGYHVWAVSMRMPLTLGDLLALAVRLPEGVVCIDFESDGERAYGLWSYPPPGCDS